MRAAEAGAPDHPSPFAAFAFLLDAEGALTIGGFSVVSADGATMTLKRGIVRSDDFARWIVDARAEPPFARDLFVTRRDERGDPAHRWRMRYARIVSWTGQGAPGQSLCAIEEIVIVAAAIDMAD